MTEARTGNGSETGLGDGHRDGQHDTPEVVRDMVTEDRLAHPERVHGAAATASADAVEAVRRGLRDLKHDVRMLKVGLDKQGQLLEYLTTRVEQLVERSDRPERPR